MYEESWNERFPMLNRIDDHRIMILILSNGQTDTVVKEEWEQTETKKRAVDS